MIRTLHSELVDDLPADHPGAIETRRDLRRLNTCMGHVGILTRELKKILPENHAARIVEIGAGDGELLLRIARRLKKSSHGVNTTLVDLRNLLEKKTKADFAATNWNVRAIECDVFEWFAETTSEKLDVIIANLVLHHFSDEQLRTLFSAAANKADAFIALEPRRARWPLFWTRWLWVIGCGPVTCHDAPVSVRAGFNGRELSALWPNAENWDLKEVSAGLFSHLFVAKRKQ